MTILLLLTTTTSTFLVLVHFLAATTTTRSSRSSRFTFLLLVGRRTLGGRLGASTGTFVGLASIVVVRLVIGSSVFTIEVLVLVGNDFVCITILVL